MIIVCYRASGIKYVAREGIESDEEFWDFYREVKKGVEATIEAEEMDDGELVIIDDHPDKAFEVVDERLADGCTRYVARPDDWPIDCGEPQ